MCCKAISGLVEINERATLQEAESEQTAQEHLRMSADVDAPEQKDR